MQPRQELEAADAKASEEHAVDEPSAADRILCWATVLREVRTRMCTDACTQVTYTREWTRVYAFSRPSCPSSAAA